MEEDLINFAMDNPFLFNKRHEDHNNFELRILKFQHLSEQLGIPAKKLRSRWRTLRDTYHRNLRLGRSNWKWMDRFSALTASLSRESSKTTEEIKDNDEANMKVNWTKPKPRPDADSTKTLACQPLVDKSSQRTVDYAESLLAVTNWTRQQRKQKENRSRNADFLKVLDEYLLHLPEREQDGLKVEILSQVYERRFQKATK